MGNVLPFRRRPIRRRLTSDAMAEIVDGAILIRFSERFGGGCVRLSADTAQAFGKALIEIAENAKADGSSE